jgi:hypothetical protein
LGFVLAAAALLIASMLHRGLTPEAISAAAVAAGVCWLAASLALVTTYIGNRLGAPVQGLLLSMMFRMGLPLLALVSLLKAGQGWAASGVTTTILGVYLVALAVETGLALRMVPAASGAAPKSKAI